MPLEWILCYLLKRGREGGRKERKRHVSVNFYKKEGKPEKLEWIPLRARKQEGSV
jgi:hypothetical protein